MMMTKKTVPDQTPKLKTLVLKVPIHCQGCQKKVLKILRGVEGVYATVIDAHNSNKVTVTGDVDADTLIKRLARSGKHADLISVEKQQPEKNKDKSNKHSKNGKHERKSETTVKDSITMGEEDIKTVEWSGVDSSGDNVRETTVVGSPVSALPPLDPIAYHYALPSSYGTEPYVVGGANEYEYERSGCFIM